MHTGYILGTTRGRTSDSVAGLAVPMIKTFYRGCKILLSPGSISILQGDEEFVARIEMDMPGLMKWAKRKVDRWRK